MLRTPQIGLFVCVVQSRRARESGQTNRHEVGSSVLGRLAVTHRHEYQFGPATDPISVIDSGEFAVWCIGIAAGSSHSGHTDMVALPFYQFSINASKPVDYRYPTDLTSIGDHLRKRRLDLGLLQRDVAKLIGVDHASIIHWEKNMNQPMVKYFPAIITFLGYNPLPRGESIAQKIKYCRQTLGLSLQELATELDIDPGTLSRWELGKREPTGRFLPLVEALFARVFPDEP